MFVIYCYTLKDSNKIQNFVNKILIRTAADSCSRRSEWDDTLVGTTPTSPVSPKIPFLV